MIVAGLATILFAVQALCGKRALVTGGGSGIGLACARALARAGAEVIVLGRREEPLRRAVADGAAHAVLVTDARDADAIVAAGPFDIVVHAAGAAESAPFVKTDLALLERMLAANLLTAFAVARAALPAMLPAGYGRLVFVASTAGLKGYPYVAAYVAAKHAVLGLVRALAVEFAASGVTINAVCPGFTDTPLLAESIARIAAATGKSADEVRRSLASHNPQRRLVQPEEVAAAVLWLCSEEASAVNGKAIAIDGGET